MSMQHSTNPHMISQAAKPFPFKKLPREIRDIIYDHVFEIDAVTATAYHTFNWIPTATESTQLASCRNPQVMLALLLVDHEIFREGARNFYGNRIFSIGSNIYPHSAIHFLKGIGKQRLDLIRTVKYSLTLWSDGHWDTSGQWHQNFWDHSRSQWRAIFRYLKLACSLQTLEIDLGHTALTRRGLTPSEWVELETCLVGIKGRVDLFVCNCCKVSVKDNLMECEGMKTEMASHKNHWTFKTGETEWSPMESVYMPEWLGKMPEGVLKRSYNGPRGACSVRKGV